MRRDLVEPGQSNARLAQSKRPLTLRVVLGRKLCGRHVAAAVCISAGPMNGHGRHLLMHSPVVVVAAGHPAPSGAPAEQTTDTSVSFAPQATVFSPVTIRNPTLPAGPGGPA